MKTAIWAIFPQEADVPVLFRTSPEKDIAIDRIAKYLAENKIRLFRDMDYDVQEIKDYLHFLSTDEPGMFYRAAPIPLMK